MESINWGGSGIEKVVFDWILTNVPKGTVIELGAGHVSTRAFAEHGYECYSVENNPEYIGHYKVHYIFAPVVNGWYDVDAIIDSLPENQDLVLIDGINREGILNYLYLFNPNAVYLIHDTYRDGMVKLANELADKLGRKAVFHTNGDYWATI